MGAVRPVGFVRNWRASYQAECITVVAFILNCHLKVNFAFKSYGMLGGVIFYDWIAHEKREVETRFC